MKHICIISAISLLTMLCLTGCAKNSKPSESKPAPNAKPAPNPPATSLLILPNPNLTIPVDDSRFVTKWNLLGPFTFADTDFGGDPQTAAADKEFMPNEAALDGTQETPAGSTATWKLNDFRNGAAIGIVDLDSFYNATDHAAVYAVAYLLAPDDITNAKLLVGSDDYIKVWINGKLVHTYKTERRAGEADQDTVSGITLKKGLNRVVVKCVDVVLDWNFFLRFTDKDSKAIGVKAE